jgi:murein DD-endopeptidase MepM/ murein hydrolase activator NlpD
MLGRSIALPTLRRLIPLATAVAMSLGAHAADCESGALCAAEAGGARGNLQRVHSDEMAVGMLNPDHDDSYLYRLPYGDRVSYAVLQTYGSRLSHRGPEQFTVDFGMGEGTPVHAARGGVVALVEDSQAQACWAQGCGRLANYVVVVHADGTTGQYYHLAPGSALVAVGDDVVPGQPLARSGNTGYSTVPHLHFGVYRAEAGGSTQSIAVRFQARGGVVLEPRAGARYENALTDN